MIFHEIHLVAKTWSDTLIINNYNHSLTNYDKQDQGWRRHGRWFFFFGSSKAWRGVARWRVWHAGPSPIPAGDPASASQPPQSAVSCLIRASFRLQVAGAVPKDAGPG